ncbi:hypothetical protein X777_02056 [Ooceraea biroi]|uniref:Uncharacterized protein n=1 Tax=Ooceraea biroi TaxID=2015173 RepID=A0A026WN78_OOCBI|nr:hypothetical protein X777_02056 [Ooceraea biroi]
MIKSNITSRHIKSKTDLCEVTSTCKFRDNKEEREAEKERGARGAGRSRNRKSRAVETSLVQLLRGWLSSDQERTTNHALANASPRETGFRIGLARTPAIYNAPAAHKDRLLTFFNYTLFMRPIRLDPTCREQHMPSYLRQ